MTHSRRSRVRGNTIANFLGGGWSALMAILFVPTYIRYLGAEAYGLVGVFVLLQTVLLLLDFGLSAAASRELARGVTEQDFRNGRDFVRTLEVITWGTAAGIALFGILAAPLGVGWLRPAELAPDQVQRALVLISFAVAAQWPSMLYGGALQGLQRQVTWNVILVVISTLRSGGAVLVLAFVAPTITGFFLWQIAIAALQTVLLAVVAWRTLPGGGPAPRLRWNLLLHHWRFAAGTAGIYGLSLVLTQLDKVVLTRILSLEAFGYYALASVVASGVYRVSGPVASAVYPQLAHLDASAERERLATLYHTACQWVAVLVFPLMAVISAFASELLWLWTNDSVVVRAAAPVLSVLVVGAVLYSLMSMPLVLQLAHGLTRLVLIANLITAIVLVPVLMAGVRVAGAVGAATAWLGANLVYLIVVGYLAHSRVLPGETWRWFARDVGLPLVAAIAVVAPARLLIPAGIPWLPMLLLLLTVGLVAILACVAVAPGVRRTALGLLHRGRAVLLPRRGHQAAGAS